jgi:adenylate cyclase
MVAVDFDESPAGPATRALAPRHVRLIDLCDEARAPVGFGCRSARCTTCRIEVLEGAEWLDPAAAEEAELLEDIGAPPEVRLACQAVVRDGTGRIRLRWIGPIEKV